MSARRWIVSLFALVVLIGMSLGATGCPLFPITLVGDPVAGEELYNTTCSQCHTLAFLQANSGLIISDLGTLNPAMAGIILTDQQIADLEAFLAK